MKTANKLPKLPAKRKRIINLLSITMVNSHILVMGGICPSLRMAQRQLRNLYQQNLAEFHRCNTKTGQQNFYYLPKSIWQKHVENKPHEIQPALLLHDSMTALFLTHIFRDSQKYGLSMKWYPPFALENKISDGGVTLYRNDELLISLLLESDTGSHDFSEMKEKMQAYLKFLKTHPHRRIIFLIVNEERRRKLQELSGENGSQILFIRPLLLKKDANVIKIILQKSVVSHERHISEK